MHVLVDRLSDASRAEALEEALRAALADVRAVVGDGGALTGAAASAAAELRATFSPRSSQEVAETADFLVLADLREYHLSRVPAVRAVRRRLG